MDLTQLALIVRDYHQQHCYCSDPAFRPLMNEPAIGYTQEQYPQSQFCHQEHREDNTREMSRNQLAV